IWDLRAIRGRLKNIGLDWEWPEFPPDKGKPDSGLPMSIQVIEDSAKRVAFLNSQAWRLATHPDPWMRHPSHAVKLAKEAVDLLPESAELWNTLGVSQYRAGHWKQA